MSSAPLRSCDACRPSPRSTAPPWCVWSSHVPRRAPRPPGRAEPPQRVPGARRRHRHEHGAHPRVGVHRGRRRHPHGRRVPGARPRLAHGGTRQLRRDPVADPPGSRRHVRPARRPSAPTTSCAGSATRPTPRTRRSCARSRARSSPSCASRPRRPRRRAATAPARSTGSSSAHRGGRVRRGRAHTRPAPRPQGRRCRRRRRTRLHAAARRVPPCRRRDARPRAGGRHDPGGRRRAPARRRRRVAALRGDVPPRGRRRDDPGVQGHLGSDRRLDRRRRRRGSLELPRAHERHRCGDRGGHRGRPAARDPRHRSHRAGRRGAVGPRGA